YLYYLQPGGREASELHRSAADHVRTLWWDAAQDHSPGRHRLQRQWLVQHRFAGGILDRPEPERSQRQRQGRRGEEWRLERLGRVERRKLEGRQRGQGVERVEGRRVEGWRLE